MRLLCQCGMLLSIAPVCPNCKQQGMVLVPEPHHDLHDEMEVTHELIATDTIKEVLPDILSLLEKIVDLEPVSDHCLLTMSMDDYKKFMYVMETAEEIQRHLKELNCSI